MKQFSTLINVNIFAQMFPIKKCLKQICSQICVHCMNDTQCVHPDPQEIPPVPLPLSFTTFPSCRIAKVRDKILFFLALGMSYLCSQIFDCAVLITIFKAPAVYLSCTFMCHVVTCCAYLSGTFQK